MRIAINGFGQIGKALACRLACREDCGFQIRAVNETHRSLAEVTAETNQQADVLPRLQGKGTGIRVEDPNCKLVTAWLCLETDDVKADEKVTLSDVSQRLHTAAASRLTRVLSFGDSATEVAGNTSSCVIDESRLRVDDGSIWLEVQYDPVASYVERLIEMLQFLERREH